MSVPSPTGVGDDRLVYLSLDVAAGRDPIQERLSAEGGFAREFTGWLVVASAINDVMDGRRGDKDATEHDR